MSVAVVGLRKAYRPSRRSHDGIVSALDGIDLDVADGELLAVVGPSGSGKTTLLRCIAGLETPDAGRVSVGGRDVSDVPPGGRDVAMVFQEFALYPHLTVAANISFGLKARKTSAEEIRRKVESAATMLSLQGVLERRPGELAGGERQRVALARAVVREPRAFLMDEPLSNLDAELRSRTRTEIKELQRRLETTTVYVTHDQVEAMTLGDRIAVLRAGRLEQLGAPMDVYERPENAFVARFFGNPPMNLFSAELLGGASKASVMGVRPEHARIVAAGAGRLKGRVRAVELTGSESIVHVELAESVFLVRAMVENTPQPGDEVGLDFEERRIHGFEHAEGRAVS